METQTQQPQQEYVNPIQNEAAALQNSEPVTSAKQAASQFDNQVQRITQQASDFFAQLPTYISRFYQEYKLPILSFALLVVIILALRIVLAVIGAVNSIPLVKPIFELIGMGYTGWFAYRFLLKRSTRQELAENVSSMKQEVLGASDNNI